MQKALHDPALLHSQLATQRDLDKTRGKICMELVCSTRVCLGSPTEISEVRASELFPAILVGHLSRVSISL